MPRPALVLVIVCAGVVLASLDLFIVNVALPSIARDLHSQPQHALLGAERLRDRLRRAAGAVRPALRGARRAERLPARRARVHARLGRLRGRHQPRHADRLPGHAGRRRGAADADLAEPGPRHHRAGEAPRLRCAPGPRSAVPRRRSARSSAACWSRASWRWVFFVNVPIGLVAVVVGWRRLPDVPGHPVKRPDALGAALITAGVGLLEAGAGRGQRLGLGLGAGRSARWPRPSSCWPASSSQLLRHHNPLIDPAPVPGPRRSAAPRSCRWSSRSRSARCCSRSSCGCRTSGAGRRCTPASRSRRGR